MTLTKQWVFAYGSNLHSRDLQRWLDENGQVYPKQHSEDAEEERLARWVNHQREEMVADQMDEFVFTRSAQGAKAKAKAKQKPKPQQK